MLISLVLFWTLVIVQAYYLGMLDQGEAQGGTINTKFRGEEMQELKRSPKTSRGDSNLLVHAEFEVRKAEREIKLDEGEVNVWLIDDNVEMENHGDGLVNSLRHINASREHVKRYPDSRSKEKLLKKYFVPRVIATYRFLASQGGTSQAESLFKFCILYKFGGVYVAPEVILSGPIVDISSSDRTNVISGSGLVEDAVDSIFISINSKRSLVMKGAIEYIVDNAVSVLENSFFVERKLGEMVRKLPSWTILQCSYFLGQFVATGLECRIPTAAPDSAPVLLSYDPRSVPSSISQIKLRSFYPTHSIFEADRINMSQSTGFRGDDYVPSSVLSGDQCDRCLKKSKSGGTCQLCER